MCYYRIMAFIDTFVMFNSAKITINTKLRRQLVTFNNDILLMFRAALCHFVIFFILILK